MDHYVPYQLALLSSRLAAELESVYRELYGLSRTEWRTLALIGETEGCAATTLVERSTMDVVAVHRAVKRLVQLGFVERDTAAHDRRLKPLGLTEAGRAAYEAVIPHASSLERKLLSRLSSEDRKSLRRVLTALLNQSTCCVAL